MGKLYTEIKVARGKPWPEKLFLEGLNAAVAQGFISRITGTGPLISLSHDGAVGFIIKETAPPIPPPEPKPPGGRRMTNMVSLSVLEVQTLADEVADLSKSLADCDLIVEARISIKPQPDVDLTEALARIKKEWRF